MDNSRLAIIIGGQLRSFFEKNASIYLLQLIQNSKLRYRNIHIVMIISGIYEKIQIHDIFKNEKGLTLEIVDYNRYEDIVVKNIEELKKDTIFNYILKKYLSNNNNACKEITNPQEYIIGGYRQIYQTHIGIEYILKYESDNNIVFDTIIRTRFDIQYPPNFVPYMPSGDTINILSLDGFGINLSGLLKKSGFSIEEYINYLKHQKINLPNCRVDCDMGITFGGAYLYNYISPEKIYNGETSILYCFNDHFYFSKRDIFIKLYDFIKIYGKLDIDNIKHIYAEESQLLMACFHSNIYPLMYLPNTYRIIR